MAASPNDVLQWTMNRYKPPNVDATAWNETTLPLRDLYGQSQASGAAPTQSDVDNAYNRFHSAAAQYFPQTQQVFDWPGVSDFLKQGFGSFPSTFSGLQQGGASPQQWDQFRFNYNSNQFAPLRNMLGTGQIQQNGSFDGSGPNWGGGGVDWGGWLKRYQAPKEPGRVSAWV